MPTASPDSPYTGPALICLQALSNTNKIIDGTLELAVYSLLANGNCADTNKKFTYTANKTNVQLVTYFSPAQLPPSASPRLPPPARPSPPHPHPHPPPVSPPSIQPVVLYSPSYLLPNSNIASANHMTYLVMQTNGDLVLYYVNNILWHSNTYNSPGAFLAIQNNGNLVVYDSNGHLVWESGTANAGSPPYALMVYDSYFELTDKNGRKIWNSIYEILYIDFIKGSSITSPSYLLPRQAVLSSSNQTMLIMQNNGDLALYQNQEDLQWSTGYQSRNILWHSNTYNSPNAYFGVQNDGNLVVYNSNDDLQWNSGTSRIGSSPYTITVYDSYFELTDKNGRKVWNNVYEILYIDFANGNSITGSIYMSS